jgi:hypothetical protein
LNFPLSLAALSYGILTLDAGIIAHGIYTSLLDVVIISVMGTSHFYETENDFGIQICGGNISTKDIVLDYDPEAKIFYDAWENSCLVQTYKHEDTPQFIDYNKLGMDLNGLSFDDIEDTYPVEMHVFSASGVPSPVDATYFKLIPWLIVPWIFHYWEPVVNIFIQGLVISWLSGQEIFEPGLDFNQAHSSEFFVKFLYSCFGFF